MRDSHSLQKLLKALLIPTNHRGVSFSSSGPRIYPSQQSEIFDPQAVRKDFSSSTFKDFLESPASVKDLLSPTAIKDFIISSYQGFIFLSKTATQLTYITITFIYHKHGLRFIASYISCNITSCFS